MGSDSTVSEAAAGCGKPRLAETARAAALGITDTKAAHLGPAAAADRAHPVLGRRSV